MNLDDALLIGAVMKALSGSAGMTHGQLANTCRTSQRRMTHHLFNMEKAGLIEHGEDGRVTLADGLMGLAYEHADRLIDSPVQVRRESWTAAVVRAVKLKQVEDKRYTQDIFAAIFGGGKRPTHKGDL